MPAFECKLRKSTVVKNIFFSSNKLKLEKFKFLCNFFSHYKRRKMNQQVGNCNGCHQASHILRFCPEQLCTECNVLGHAERDCPQQFQLGQFCLWLPYTLGARIGISQVPLREVLGVGRNLQLIRSAGRTTMNGSSFETIFNSLRINYGGEG